MSGELIEWWADKFRIIHTCSGAGQHAMQATCPYHRATRKTGCTRRINMKEWSPAETQEKLWILCWWCNESINCRLHDEHKTVPTWAKMPLPAEAIIMAQRPTKPVPDPVLTDEEMWAAPAVAIAAAPAVAPAAAAAAAPDSDSGSGPGPDEAGPNSSDVASCPGSSNSSSCSASGTASSSASDSS